MTTKKSECPQLDYLARKRERDLAGDLAFKYAMLRARALGRERFRLGVIQAEATERPRFIHQGYVQRSRSPALLCADRGDERVGSAW